jgi:hypothetical protein
MNAEEKLHKLSVTIDIECPMSEELQAYIDAVPTEQSPTFEEWQASFAESMTALIQLAQSGKVRDCGWTSSVISPDDEVMSE